MSRTSVAITGFTGFVGRRLATRLLSEGHEITGVVRRPISPPELPLRVVNVGAIGAATDWRNTLAGIDVVIHLAARTHAVHEQDGGDIHEYRSINVDGTARLAEAAAASGVRRFIFLSSIKVNGNQTLRSRPFVSGDRPAPQDPYGVSKWEAERLLAQVAAETGLEPVVIRPPLVYGPSAKGNFARLCQVLGRGVPLPLGAVDNRRSLVALDNLVDLIARCVADAAAPGQTFLVSDGEDVSTPELIRRTAQAMGVKARLLPIPPNLLHVAGRLIGRGAEVSRLVSSLQVDIKETRDKLKWTPPITLNEGLRRAVARD